jgi:hypothetical protein
MINNILLLINLVLIYLLVKKLKIKRGLILYSCPILVYVAGNFFYSDFLNLGDGISYYNEYIKYFVNNSETIEVNKFKSLLDYLKIVNFGIVPIYFVITEYLEGQGSEVYFSLQSTYYLVLICMAIFLTYSEKKDYSKVFKIVSASCIFSPFIFDLLAAPTRHIVTLVAGFLIYFSYKNIRLKLNFYNTGVFFLAISLLLISKAILFPFFLIFILCDLYFYSKTSKKYILIFSLILLTVLFINLDLLISYIFKYGEISETGANTFSSLTKILFIGWFIKYVYAILAPFPWITDTYALDLIYGGNIFLYIIHIFSSLLVLYIFICIIFEFKNIYLNNKNASNSILYGLIMSSSILFGSTGFNIYLIIWVPFLLPAAFCIKPDYFYLILTLLFPIICEFFIFVYK